MYILISLFAGSLFLIAVFFAIKEHEVYRGRETLLTRWLRRHSPHAEQAAARIADYGVSYGRSLFSYLRRLYEKTLHYLSWGARALVVLLAERMIHAVKGEKLLSSRSASSIYLKHLKEHKENIGNGAPQV